MKILFTADIHINLRQKNVPKPWALSRYSQLFNSLQSIYKYQNCELLVIGGDIFDKLPSLEELGLFLSFLKQFEGNILFFDGNHEATRKGETFLSLLKPIYPEHCIFVDEYMDCEDFKVLPYCELHKWKGDSGKLLFTHVRGEIPPHVKPELDLSIFENFELVLAGDLHSHGNSQLNIVYPGSPMTITFHRNPVDTGVIVIESDTLEWEFVNLNMPQLIRKTVNSAEDMIKTEFDHTIYELVADVIDLTKVKNSDLLDKKISQSTSESTLNLRNLSLEQELDLYCTEILNLDKEKINKLMRVYNDYVKDIRVV